MVFIGCSILFMKRVSKGFEGEGTAYRMFRWVRIGVLFFLIDAVIGF